MIRIRILLLLAFLAACSAEPGITLKLLDSRDGSPVEGSVIYVTDHHVALRSDVNGDVHIPAQYNKETISVEAKNYHAQHIDLSEPVDNEIVMQFDAELVSPAEARLRFTRQDTLQGTYGPYRSNNDLISYA